MVTEVSASVVGTRRVTCDTGWCAQATLTAACCAWTCWYPLPGLLDQVIVQHAHVVDELHELTRQEVVGEDHLSMLDGPDDGGVGASGPEASVLSMWRLPPDNKVGLLNRLLDDFVEAMAVEAEE